MGLGRHNEDPMNEGESQITWPADWNQVSEALTAEASNVHMRKEASQDDSRRHCTPYAPA